jgi:pimeloyl-ACP methyl ester carboxylesterase
MKSMLLTLLLVFLSMALLVTAGLFFLQESLLFFPEKLSQTYRFDFEQKFEEVIVNMDDGTPIHGLLFKSEQSKGLIFYLHGNAGSLRSWGAVAKTYTELDYDVFVVDYRGYGKSEGKISGEKQLFSDMQQVYSALKKIYGEDNMIVLGYSIGSGPATYLAAVNHPQKLILQAPFYSLTDVVKNYFPFMPPFLIKYKFENFSYLQKCSMPVVIFHGDRDEVIPFTSSLRLKEHLKEGDRVIILKGQDHNGMTFNQQYLSEIQKVLD